MLTIEQARKIVLDTIQAMEYSVPNDKLIILDNLTIEKPYAWIFNYTSELWYETEDNKYAVGGNSPIIVDKKTGEQTTYSTAFGLDSLIDKYEEEKSLWHLNIVTKQVFKQDQLLILKSKFGFANDKLLELKNQISTCLDKGSESRLKLIQSELDKIGIETSVSLLYDKSNT